MRNLRNPKLLFFINTIPLVILFFLFWAQFTIIKSLLKPESIEKWAVFAVVLAALAIANFSYVIYLVAKKKPVSIYYGAIALLVYIPFIYLYFKNSDDMIPFDVPNWMIPDGMLLVYAGTFLMPTLAYAIFIIVVRLTPIEKDPKAWKSFLAAAAIPLGWYLFAQLVMPLWKTMEKDINIHVALVFCIVGVIVFLFFILRSIYILALKKAGAWKKYQLAWKIPIAIVFPVLGLLVNNGKIFNAFSSGAYNWGIFGNFNDPWFYILALANGILICLPNLENKPYRIALFVAQSVTFAYTLYFFFVFLPFLPLSIFAIILIGTGFLMLTPIVLLVIHIDELTDDFNYLQAFFSRRKLGLISLLGFFVLPVWMAATYLKDRHNLAETLDYVYNPDYSKDYEAINLESLSSTLAVVKQNKERNHSYLMGGNVPYLSSFFNWLVLDNLVLSDTKINTIESIFYGKPRYAAPNENTNDSGARLSKIGATSKYDQTQNAWISQIDLDITRHQNESFLAEYATTLTLPEGCFISDYYLYVDGKKEMGILAEKKAALWVFSQIVNTNRDPGILHYVSGNKVAFRIFPFAANETRKTGFEIIHKNPVVFTIDGQSVLLGNPNQPLQNIPSQNKPVIYVSGEAKKSLKAVQRKPYYHFIIDLSKGKSSHKKAYISRIGNLLAQHKISPGKFKVSFANSYVSVYNRENWQQKLLQQKNEGGYFLERGIKKALLDAYDNEKNSYPVIVAVTDSISKSIIDKDFSELKITYPESDFFYDLDDNGQLIPHSLVSNPLLPITENKPETIIHSSLAFPDEKNPIAFLPNDRQASVVLKNPAFPIAESDIKLKNWDSALLLQGKWISQNLHPENAEKEWLELVRYSFLSKIMTPVTSYLVVENEAQKQMLKRKQQQILSGNKSLDPDEDIQSMSEPGLIVTAILLGLFLYFRERKKLQSIP